MNKNGAHLRSCSARNRCGELGNAMDIVWTTRPNDDNFGRMSQSYKTALQPTDDCVRRIALDPKFIDFYKRR
jgi:hypothetical protein